MPEPLTIEEFRRFSSTFEEALKRSLNDRFEHYEKRAVQRELSTHSEIMGGFAEVISTVNDHMDERFDIIERRLDALAVQQELRREFDALVSFVSSKYNVSAAEIISQGKWVFLFRITRRPAAQWDILIYEYYYIASRWISIT